MQEMLYRERVRGWKEYELDLQRELWRRYGTEKSFEKLYELATDIMQMALHVPRAYEIREKPDPEPVEVAKSDQDMLALLDSLPEL
jgi:hypothetical protein